MVTQKHIQGNAFTAGRMIRILAELDDVQHDAAFSTMLLFRASVRVPVSGLPLVSFDRRYDPGVQVQLL